MMRGLMQDAPLALPLLMDRLEKVFSHKLVISPWRDAEHPPSVTYGELAVRLGLAAGARVGTFLWNSQEHLELYLAVPCTSRILHTVNPRLFSEQIRYILDDAQDEIVFIAASLLEELWPTISSCETVRHVVVVADADDVPVPDDPRIMAYEELLVSAPAYSGDFVVEDERLAASLCYTSGTTGNPKGVLYDHRSVILHALQLQLADVLGICEKDVILPMVPLFHVNAWGLTYSAIMSGATLVLPGPVTSGEQVLAMMARHRVTFSAAVTTVWARCADSLENWDLASVRGIVAGGGPISTSLADKYLDKAGIPLIGAWGLTESSPIISTGRVSSIHEGRDRDRDRDLAASAGVPIPLSRVRIVDEDDRALPNDGVAFGELQVSAPTAARAYFGTNGAQNGFTADGWLRSGDVATIDPWGYIRIVDRTKDLIKSGGEWIPSVQLEDAILTDPRVREVAVVGVAHLEWGERPAAWIVPVPGSDLSAQDVREYLVGRVAKWWIPELVELVDALPRTATGKVSKKTLRDAAAV
jgi:fatty-acyl-CoA synthase